MTWRKRKCGEAAASGESRRQNQQQKYLARNVARGGNARMAAWRKR